MTCSNKYENMTSCDFKACKERKKKEAAHARNHVICAPDAYYDAEFQRSLMASETTRSTLLDALDRSTAGRAARRYCWADFDR